MGAKLIVRVKRDDHVEVRVEGLTEIDRPKPQGKKLCNTITKRLERDLGIVERRDYADDPVQIVGFVEQDRLQIEGS